MRAIRPVGRQVMRACMRFGIALAALGVAEPLVITESSLRAQEISDSLRNVVLERLDRLARRMGDSTGLRPDTASEGRTEAMADDTTLQALLELPGYDLYRYNSRSASFETATRVLTLLGDEAENAVMNREGLELSADSALVFDERTGRLVTQGSQATYRPQEGDEVLTRRIIYDLGQGRGTALDARTTMSAGMGSWIVSGDFPWVDRSRSFGHSVMFTSCEEDEPHYHFVAREIKLQPGGTMVARNVLLYFGDVGVFWLPFIAQSTEQGRRSGLLPIRFSVNDIVRTSASYARRVSNLGYYWAMSDYSDAQLGLDWWSGNYIGLTGAAQYHWRRQFLEGQVNYRHFWREASRSELAFDTNHSWKISERTKVHARARYASSASFVRRNSFDPREVTSSIDSDGGFSREFDIGTLSLSANRRQFLTDDRVEMTLPTANFSLKPITLFPAPVGSGRFYNKLTLSALAGASRSIEDYAPQDVAPDSFKVTLADRDRLRGTFSATLSAGALSVRQGLTLNRNTRRGLPQGLLNPATSTLRTGAGSVAALSHPHFAAVQPVEGVDLSADTLTWETTVNYQVQLVGSTSLTPKLVLKSSAIRSDTLTVGGGGFVSAPRRLSFGADLKSDIYGFWNGGRLRHKITPSIGYDYSPRTEPTAVQSQTFGARAIQPKNEIWVSLTQTFEARVGDGDDVAGDTAESVRQPADRSRGPRRLPQSQKMTLLALRTSAVTYDFEQASEAGHFTRGFQDNLRISNQVSSDFLRGLSVSLEHDVFDDAGAGPDGGARRFDPFLSNVNMSFSLSHNSLLFRWLRGLTGDRGSEATTPAQGAQGGDVSDPLGFGTEDIGEATVVPTGNRNRSAGGPRPESGRVGQWDARFSYSLVRTREAGGGNQMVQGQIGFQPTEKWSVRWRTSYDAAAGAFNDHMVTMKRNLHRWDADFSFRQTATGNWSFMFEVALADNRDLHFDYEQRAGGEMR